MVCIHSTSVHFAHCPFLAMNSVNSMKFEGYVFVIENIFLPITEYQLESSRNAILSRINWILHCFFLIATCTYSIIQRGHADFHLGTNDPVWKCIVYMALRYSSINQCNNNNDTPSRVINES